ncbi:hypothetical protein U1Q18_036024 [Sarracenia purpurea var. burkii]
MIRFDPTAPVLFKTRCWATRDLFEGLLGSPCFRDSSKQDAGQPEICSRPHEPHPNSQSLENQAYHYIAVKFKELYASVIGRKLFVWQTRARELSSANQAFKYIREVLKWEDEKDENMYDEANEDDAFISQALLLQEDLSQYQPQSYCKEARNQSPRRDRTPNLPIGKTLRQRGDKRRMLEEPSSVSSILGGLPGNRMIDFGFPIGGNPPLE